MRSQALLVGREREGKMKERMGGGGGGGGEGEHFPLLVSKRAHRSHTATV